MHYHSSQMALVYEGSVANSRSVVVEAKVINWLSPTVGLRGGQRSRLNLLRLLSWPHFLAPDTLPLSFLAIAFGLVIRFYLIINKWALVNVAHL